MIGRFKEVAGKIVDDKEMELEGNLQKNAGKAHAKWGYVKEIIKKTVERKSLMDLSLNQWNIVLHTAYPNTYNHIFTGA